MPMRASTSRCRSFAAWYSAFSRRSPSSRARLISLRELELQLALERLDLVFELLDQLSFIVRPVRSRRCGSRPRDPSNECYPCPPCGSTHDASTARTAIPSSRFRARRARRRRRRPPAARRRPPGRRGAGRRRRGSTPAAVAAEAESPSGGARAWPQRLGGAGVARRGGHRRRCIDAISPGPLVQRRGRAGRAPDAPIAGAVRAARATGASSRSTCRIPATSAPSSASAEAGGATGVVCGGACADPFGWKALRGSMGSALRLPVAPRASVAGRRARGARGTAAASSPRRRAAGGPPARRRPRRPGRGPDRRRRARGCRAPRSTRPTSASRIPMRPPVESLNVAVTAALLVYEAARQRNDDDARGSRLEPGRPRQTNDLCRFAVRRRALAGTAAPPAGAPLADRMRPRTLDEFVGQDELLAPGTPLREAIERDLLQSIILWGPPGTGKTTLARHHRRARRRAHFVAVQRRALRHQGDHATVMAEAERLRARRRAAARSSSSTRSTASTRRSRTRSCRTSRRATSS